MPKKTKKQKVLAEIHRQKSPFSYTFNETTDKPQKLDKAEPIIEFNTLPYIVSDLKKTLILTTLAILFVLVLYWWWR